MKKYMDGFALVEFAIVMAVFVTLLLIATISLTTVKQKASLSTSVDILIADMKQQQLKAMVGETEGRGSADSYGLHFGTSSYVLFHGTTYISTDSANLAINLGDNINVASSPADIIFSQLSGNVASGSAIITLRDATTTLQKTVNMNKYGIVTSVN